MTLPAEPFKGSKPKMPEGLGADSQRAWRAWWASPMAHMWTTAEWPLLLQAIRLIDAISIALEAGNTAGLAALMGEQRRLLDGLGLTEKGRRDVRWLLPGEPEETETGALQQIRAASRYRHLTLRETPDVDE